MRTIPSWTGLLAALSLTPVEAANVEIRALFQPDPAQPSKNIFINKTPNSGYCASAPAECEQQGMFSIQIPVRLDSSRPIVRGDELAMQVPANWRQLTVINRDTQETEIVEVRIIGLGSEYILSDKAATLTGQPTALLGHQNLWSGSSWVYAPPPCGYSGVGFYGDASYRFFWKAPVEAACTKTALFEIPSMVFNTLDFAYELRTPNPLGMSSGLYTGSLSYNLGPQGDFQMGSMMLPDDGNLSLDFVLDVQHTLKVDLPPGGNKVVLQPEGGWRRWIDTGRPPPRIFADQKFLISASSRFKVTMFCPSSLTHLCELGDDDGDTNLAARYTITMTLPSGITGPAGEDGWSGLLRNGLWAGPFQPTRYVDRKAGSLRFEIYPPTLPQLLKPGVSGKLRSWATVIWDSEV